MRLRRVSLSSGLAVIAAAVALSACGGGESPPAARAAEAPKVTIKAFDFQPDPITVKAGSTITFVNTDQIKHTATAGTRDKPTPKVFNAKLAAAPGPGESTQAEVTFDNAGTYDFFCRFHPGDGMVGKVVVTG